MKILVEEKARKNRTEAQNLNVQHSNLYVKVKYDCSLSAHFALHTVVKHQTY